MDAYAAVGAMTAATCNGQCQGFKYFGLQNGNACFCGNDYGNKGGKAPETECNMTCTGSSAEMCGSSEHNSIYAVTTSFPFSCDAATGQCVESRNGTLSAEACIDGCKAPTYSCNAATGQCAADPQGTQTAQGCDATCKALMYSCNTTAGKCVEDPSGTQTAESCIGSCKCVAPHNCGQLNGTMQCGAVLAGCNVCDSCCQDYFHQHSCDGCFAAPVSEQGCGGQ